LTSAQNLKTFEKPTSFAPIEISTAARPPEELVTAAASLSWSIWERAGCRGAGSIPLYGPSIPFGMLAPEHA
jgi:hypothetical protein